MIISVVQEKRVIFKEAIKEYNKVKEVGMPTLKKRAMAKAQLACKELCAAVNDVSTVE